MELLRFNGDFMGITGNWMVISWELLVFNGDLMGITGV